MQLYMLTSLFGVAVSIAVVYAVVRLFVNDAQRYPLHAARSHGMVTALIGLFATSTAALTELAVVDDRTSFPSLGAGMHAVPAAEVTMSMGLNALMPALWLPLVYWVAQRTWPASVAPARSARLTARSWTEFLPRALTITVGAVAAAALIATFALWPTPGRPMQVSVGVQNGYAPDGGPAAVVADVGVRGGELSPWLLTATVLFCLGAALAIAAVLRRRALAGLSPAQDDAVRHVAVNRILRTLALMLVGVIGTAGTSLGYQQGQHGGATQPWAVGLGLAVLVTMAAWRSPHLAVLREEPALYTHEDGAQEWVEVPRGPGTLSDVIQLRHTAAAVLIPVGALAMILGYVAVPALFPDDPGRVTLALTVVPPVLLLAMLFAGYLLTEFVLRMRHTDRTATPRTRGVRASTWRVVLFGVVAAAGLVTAGWAVREQRELARAGLDAVPLALGVVAGLVVVGALTAVGVRLCLHRRPLARTSTVMDRRMRRRTADRMVGVGTTGLLLVLVAGAGGLLFGSGASALAGLLALLPALLPGTPLARPIGDAQDPADGSGVPDAEGWRPSSGRPEAAGGSVAAGAEAGR